MPNPLGIALQDTLQMDPVFSQGLNMPAPSAHPKMGKGQIIMGIIADALAGAAGRQGGFAQMLGQQKQQEMEDAQWSRRQASQLQNQMALKEYDRAHPDPSPMERDATAWQNMTPEQRAAYREAQAAKPQFIPDGMGGGRWASPPVAGAAPAGPPAGITFTPIPGTGGPTQPASGGFRRFP